MKISRSFAAVAVMLASPLVFAADGLVTTTPLSLRSVTALLNVGLCLSCRKLCLEFLRPPSPVESLFRVIPERI